MRNTSLQVRPTHDFAKRTDAKIRHFIRGLIARFKNSLRNALLVEDLEYHSLALLEIASALEDEFDLRPIDEKTARQMRWPTAQRLPGGTSTAR
jgi:acyl carrier protein